VIQGGSKNFRTVSLWEEDSSIASLSEAKFVGPGVVIFKRGSSFLPHGRVKAHSLLHRVDNTCIVAVNFTMNLKLLSGCIFLLLTVLASPAETMLIPASADSVVFITHPDQNYGSRTNLRVGPITDNDGTPSDTGGFYGRGLKRAFIKFDTSVIPTNAYITNVVFRAFQTDGSLFAGGFHIFAVDGDWQESMITWSNQPTELTLLGTMSLVAGDLASFTNTALTELVRSWHAAEAAADGISLRVSNEERANNGDTLASRESLTRPPPHLVVDYSWARPQITYDITALVDIANRLIIRGSEVQWQHPGTGATIGRHAGSNEPTVFTTTLDGATQLRQVAWIPEWPEPPPAEIRYEASSSTFRGLLPALPSGDVAVSASMLDGRGSVAVEQIPSAENGWALIIRFADGFTGAAPIHARISVSYAQLSARRIDPVTLQLTWPTNTQNYLLEMAIALPALANGWAPVTNTVTISGSSNAVPVGLTETKRFFRLRRR
jgi:hypothetical protein